MIQSYAGSANYFNKGTSKLKNESIEGKPGILSPSWNCIARLMSRSVYWSQALFLSKSLYKFVKIYLI